MDESVQRINLETLSYFRVYAHVPTGLAVVHDHGEVEDTDVVPVRGQYVPSAQAWSVEAASPLEAEYNRVMGLMRAAGYVWPEDEDGDPRTLHPLCGGTVYPFRPADAVESQDWADAEVALLAAVLAGE